MEEQNLRSSGEPTFSCKDRPSMVEQRLGAARQSRPEHGMGKIGARLVRRADAVEVSRRGACKPAKLREHKPHPMALLAAGLEFGQGCREDRCLRSDEAL